ncbi:MAG: hypothetical protein HC905_29065 [Bacteroidales bacterium]|nr:hypothetical protein [Bacteroidales bacterium]
MTVFLNKDENKQISDSLFIPDVKLWSPESPFLYVLEASSQGDTLNTRFGMRKLRFDIATRRAFLNDTVYFLRGTNLPLFRVMEDSLCGSNPWREEWINRLLRIIPKEFHWNMIRTHISVLPEKWLDMCDEEGLMLQYEFPWWTTRSWWDTKTTITETKRWMKDSWNHPSVVIWDICNETKSPQTREVIEAVRNCDLSDRPWDNGYSLPVKETDPIEDHHYLSYLQKWGHSKWEKDLV